MSLCRCALGFVAEDMCMTATAVQHLDAVMQRTAVPMPPPFRAAQPGDPPAGHPSVIRQFSGEAGSERTRDVIVWLQNAAAVSSVASKL
eukprot:COSAG01_NODE_1467_length_10217_cov_33.824570_15_plen_89_part_00